MNDNYFKSIYFNSSSRLYDRGIFNNTNKLTNEIVKIIDGKFDKAVDFIPSNENIFHCKLRDLKSKINYKKTSILLIKLLKKKS